MTKKEILKKVPTKIQNSLSGLSKITPEKSQGGQAQGQEKPSHEDGQSK